MPGDRPGGVMSQPRPDWSGFESIIGDLRRSLGKMSSTQRELMQVTGTAWSPDRLIKATVGPRGQLVELEIDPRVYRRPNSTALAASIVATVRAAVDDVLTQSAEIMDSVIDPSLTAGFGLDSPIMRMSRRHDDDVIQEASMDDEQ